MKARVAVFMIFFSVIAMAAIPQIIQYQGKLTDISGVGENDTLDMRFNLYDVETAGDSIWTATVTDVPIVHGLFDVDLGPIDLTFDQQYWLEIIVADNVLAPRIKLASSPYAFRAAVADSLTGSGISLWADSTTFIMVNGQKGVFGYGNVAYGVHDSTHVNLGVNCETGQAGLNNKYCSVGGGLNNIAGGEASYIGGGNSNLANGENAVIVGGLANEAPAYLSFVGGGQTNFVNGSLSAIVNGANNVITHDASFIGSGDDNIISGRYSFIPTGYSNNVAGDYSFAFGRDCVTTSDYIARFFTSTYPGTLFVGGDVVIENTLYIENVPEETMLNNLLTYDHGHVRRLPIEDIPADSDWVVSSENVYRASGNVGIGTTTPMEKLDIEGNFRISGLILADTIQASFDTVYIPDRLWVDELVTDSIESRGNILTVHDALYLTDSLYFGGEWYRGFADNHSLDAADGDPIDALYVDNSGNVGIGRVSPDERLHIFGSGSQIVICETERSHKSGYYVMADSIDSEFGNENGWGMIQKSSGDYAIVETNFFGMPEESDRFVIKNNVGYIGIGTSDPSCELEVDGHTKLENLEVGNNITLGGEARSSWGEYWALKGNTGTDPDSNFLGTTDDNPIVFKLNNTEKIRFTTKGQIEISNTGGSIYLGSNNGDSDDLSDNHNIGFGTDVLSNLTTGENNIAIGHSVLCSLTTGSGCIAIGNNALRDREMGGSIAIGDGALKESAEGMSNIAVGINALTRLNFTFGSYNVAIGNAALANSGTGEWNTAVGHNALLSNQYGLDNTAVGSKCLYELGYDGSNNTGLGSSAGYNLESGDYNIMIGRAVAAPDPYGDYQLNIGNTIYGVLDSGFVGIGVTVPERKLHISDVMRLEPRDTAPSDASEGDIYMDSTTHKLKVFDGVAWQACW